MLIKLYLATRVIKLPGSSYRMAGTVAWTALLTFFCLTLEAQTITVKGRVADDKGPLPGVSVQLKGGSTGASTDANGNFQISAPPNGTLVFSSIGYETKEEPINNRSQLTVTLSATVTMLQDIVVVGYGTQRKKDVTGSTASVNLETMREIPNTNIGQYLQGTIPGLNVGISTSAGGTPPINIRGRTTLAGSRNVLIILDGGIYTQSLSSINPDDIASIDVLKGASATAVYGAQAANGVILITSRKGRAGQTRVSFSSSYSVNEPTTDVRPQNREQYLENIRLAFYDRAFLAPDYTQPNPDFRIEDVVDATMVNADRSALLPNDYSWWDEATSRGHIVESNLSVLGGTDKVTYLISGSITDQKNFIINDKFKRKQVRANIETRPISWIKLGLLSQGSFVNQDGAEPALPSILHWSPLQTPYDESGNLIPFPTKTLEGNPFMTYYVDDHDRNNYLFANTYIDADLPFLKGLNYRLNLVQNYRNAERFFSSIYGASQTGEAYKQNNRYYDYTIDNILTYTKAFGKHDISGTLLYGASKRDYNENQARATGFSRLNLSYNDLSLGTTQLVTSGGYSEALNYQMARVNYKYSDRYLVTATIRRDGFSGFAENYKYGIFPALALGWVASEESFIKNMPAVNFLKLRAEYGTSGNQVGRYSSIPVVGTSTNYAYVFGDGSQPSFGQRVETLGNPNLKWERTRGFNVGADFTLFNNRFNGAIDVYSNKTTDLIYRVNIPETTGFTNIFTNLGGIKNSGIEANLSYRIVNNTDFNWTASVNFSRNVNKITELTGQDLDGDGKEDDLVNSGLFIGRPISAFYNYQQNGIYQIGETPLPGFFTGTNRIVDQNNDGQITPESDRVFLGSADPAYRISLDNTFNYRNFSLRVFINSIQGGSDGYRGNAQVLYFREDNTIRNNGFYPVLQDRWSPINPNGKYPLNISGAHARVEPPLYESRSFVRLQDVSLSYNFASLLPKIKARSVNLFVSGKNLALWTNWKGWDPEAVDQDGNPYPFTDAGRPVMRAVTLGLNVVY